MSKYIDGKIVVSGGSSGFTNMQNPINIAKLIKQATDESPEYKVQSSNIAYDNTVSGLTATDVKGAIDEIQSEITTIQNEWTYLEVDIPSSAAGSIVYSDGRPNAVGGILGMGTTPVELLPAPGTGKYYNIESLIVEYNAGTTAYTYVAPEDMLWIYGDTTTYLTTDIGQTLTDSFAISSVQAANNVFNTGANNYTTYETLNRPVSLSTWTTTDWTLGNGTLKIKIKYKVVTFG